LDGDAGILGLLATLFDAVESPALWEPFLGGLVVRFGAEAGRLLIGHVGGNSGSTRWEIGLDGVLRDGLDRYWRSRIASLPTEEGLRRGACLWGQFSLTETAPAEPSTAFVGSLLLREESETLHFDLVRRAPADAFTDEDGCLLLALAPHFRRALGMRRQMSALTSACESAWAALDRLPIGVFVVDAGGRVAKKNRAAERLLAKADGLSVSNGRLEAGKPPETAALHALVASAASAVRAAGPHSEAVLVSRPSGNRAFHFCAAPVPPGSELRQSGERTAVVFVSDPAPMIETPPEILQRTYGLTLAEARLAGLLVAGHSLEEAVFALGTSLNTVKTQLRGLFTKLDVHRQSDLIRLLLTGPASLDINGA
jgi:DNA-binding CsgD family transcriptional regulator/PAS domain-containing protein